MEAPRHCARTGNKEGVVLPACAAAEGNAGLPVGAAGRGDRRRDDFALVPADIGFEGREKIH